MWNVSEWIDTEVDTWDCEELTAAKVAAAAKAQAACTADGADCTLSGCCKNTAHKCFRKNEHWSACNESCLPKRVFKDGKWQDTTDKTWDCDVILPHQVAKPPTCINATPSGQNCSTGCCEEGMLCYKKDEHHFSCNTTCTPNAKWETDKWVTTDDPVWDCTVVKPEVDSADVNECTDPTEGGQDCTHTGCCKDPAATCFKKNKHWASCNATCNPYAKWEGGWVVKTEKVWDCDVIYPPAVPKVKCDTPTDDGQDCSQGKCCTNSASVCFKKNEHWASCMDRCWTNKKWEGGKWVEKDEKVWDCDVLTPATSRLYAMVDMAASSQPSVASRPLLAVLALGVVAGGSLAVFRRPRLREVPQEDSAAE